MKNWTWREAIIELHPDMADNPGYRNGYRSGWLDYRMGYKSTIARFSTIPNYSQGYEDGFLDCSTAGISV